MDIATAKRQFLEYIEIEKGRSLKTVENYDRYITRFVVEMNTKRLGDITEDKLREFRLRLNRASGIKVRGQSASTMKKNTQNYYMIALRSFLKYCRKRGWDTVAPDVIELAKTGARHLDLISIDELTRLLKAPDLSTVIGLRDKALLELFSQQDFVSQSFVHSIMTSIFLRTNFLFEERVKRYGSYFFQKMRRLLFAHISRLARIWQNPCL
jgi:site-specific recombinase XerD